MSLLIVSALISLLTIFVAAFWMHRSGRHLNLDQLQVFIAVATGFMIAILFFDLLPENLEHFSGDTSLFFKLTLAGMFVVVAFERYLVPRLKFVDRFLAPDPETRKAALKEIDVHDPSLHDDDHDHHHHQDLAEAEACNHSHAHGHLHVHTHPEVLGRGEVCSAIACFMICSFFDGVALSSVQNASPRLGILLILGVILHLLPEGILSAAMVLAGGASFRSAQKVIFVIGGSFFAGACLPYFVTGMESTFLAVSSGILLFVTLVQLLPSALKMKYAPAWIFLGAAVYGLTHQILVWSGVVHTGH